MTRRTPLALAALAALSLAAAAAAPARAQTPEPIARAASLFRRAQYPAVRATLAAYVQSHPRDARGQFYVGWSYLRQNQPDSAVAYLERAVELDGASATYHLQLGNAYGLKAMGANPIRRALLARSAKGEYDRAVELEPGNLDARWGLMRFYMLAPGILGGDEGRAREQAEEIRRRNPYRAVQADVYLARQRRDPAAVRAAFAAGVRAFPDSVASYLNYGRELDAQRQYAAEHAVYRDLLRRRPGYMVGHFMIGRLGAVSGERLSEAEQSLQRYLGYNPVGAEPPIWVARWRLGMVYERQGRRDLARAQYREATRLNRAAREPREALARLGG